MRNSLTILKRELRAYFTSNIAYIVLLVFLFLCGFFFVSNVRYFSDISEFSIRAANDPYSFMRELPKVNSTEFVVRPFYSVMALLMLWVMPLLTMNVFAAEKKTGTIELLFTYPLRDWETIIGKYSACTTVFIVMLAGSFLFPILLDKYLGAQPEWPVIWLNYLGVFLMGASFIALGVFISSMSDDPLIAGFLTWGASLLVWLISFFVERLPYPRLVDVLQYLSLYDHFMNFSKGVFELKDAVFYITFTVFFLFLTMCSLGSKRWRS